ncbi:MAG: hypothetical protein M3373_14175 [Gemmatimonadota bacterium]|nr:hypothetical protein [Gemmatimonadota bacterium]
MPIRARPPFAMMLVTLALIACDQPREPARSDTAAVVAPPPPDTTPAPVRRPAWAVRAGPVLVVRDSASVGGALVILPLAGESAIPDSARGHLSVVDGATLDLFNVRGSAGKGVVADVLETDAGDACGPWMAATVRPAGGDTASGDWTVAFAPGRVRPVPLYPVEMMPTADSARLAAEVTRLASALPDSPASPFRGLPFRVRTAHRFSAAPGVVAVAADLVRKVPQEAMPLEEHTLLVAERDSADAEARFRDVYHDRRSATEERVVTNEVLASVRVGTPGRTSLVLALIGYDSISYAMLERSPAGRWRMRWVSGRGC